MIKKRMPIWKLVVVDISLSIVCIGVFLLFHYIIPRVSDAAGKTIITGNDTFPTFNLPSDKTPVPTIINTPHVTQKSTMTPGTTKEPHITGKLTPTQTSIVTPTPTLTPTATPTPTPTPTEEPLPYEYAKRYKQSPFESITMPIDSYENGTSEIYLRKVEIGEGSDKITYYVGDVFISSVQELKTAFAQGKYGRNIREDILDIADDNGAIFAISGDFYTNTDLGVVIRNGVYYRSKDTDNDICVLYLNGTLKTYHPSEFDIDKAITQGAWHAWTFGPGLLDGNGEILKSFNCTSYIKQTHPRTAIGYVRPGHYVFVVVDGRDTGYSKGVDLTELAQIMYDEGCVSAYNLDGGKTASMAFDGRIVNNPAGGGRTIGDIVYIGK